MTPEEKKVIAEKKKHRREFIHGLREMASCLQKNKELPLPSADLYIWGINTKDELKKNLKGLGKVKKEFLGSLFYVRKDFGAGVQLVICLNREQVCTKKVEIVTEEERVPIEYETKMVEKEVITWDCSDPILASAKE